MKFWDSSAIVPLLCTESETHAMLELYGADPSMLVWALTRTEIISALCRRHREGAIARRELSEAKARLKLLESDWTENSDYRLVRNVRSACSNSILCLPTTPSSSPGRSWRWRRGHRVLVSSRSMQGWARQRRERDLTWSEPFLRFREMFKPTCGRSEEAFVRGEVPERTLDSAALTIRLKLRLPAILSIFDSAGEFLFGLRCDESLSHWDAAESGA